jgi:hypothetical protein
MIEMEDIIKIYVKAKNDKTKGLMVKEPLQVVLPDGTKLPFVESVNIKSGLRGVEWAKITLDISKERFEIIPVVEEFE